MVCRNDVVSNHFLPVERFSFVIFPPFVLKFFLSVLKRIFFCLLSIFLWLLIVVSFVFRRTPEDASVGDASEKSESVQERLTKEEWQAINKLLSYQPDEDLTVNFGKDSQSMVHFLVDVSIGQAAARIIDISQTEIVCGRFEQLHVSTKFKNRSTHCDLTLRFYGLSSPEGSLAQVCFYIIL